MRYSIIVAALLLAGCSKPMKNVDTIATVKMCDTAGMNSKAFYSDWPILTFHVHVSDVQCWPDNAR